MNTLKSVVTPHRNLARERLDEAQLNLGLILNKLMPILKNVAFASYFDGRLNKGQFIKFAQLWLS